MARRNGIVVLAVLAGAGLVGGGCSLFTPFGDYGGGEDVADVDAGATAVDATAPDAAPAPPTDGAPAPSRYAAAVLADAPVLYLRFGEQDGLVAHDETGRSDGAYPLVGLRLGVPGAIAGDTDTAIALDGTSGVQIPQGHDYDGLAAFTVEAWIKRSPAATNNLGFIVDHQTWSGGRRGWLLGSGPTRVSVERYSDPNTHNAISYDLTISDGWHHVAAHCDGTRQRLFVDGVLRREGQCSVAIPRIEMPFLVGNQNCSCSGNGFIGDIDELAIYDKPLTDTRIRAHFEAAR